MILSATSLGDLTNIKTGKLDANASSEDGQYPFFTCAQKPLRISSYSYDCECVLIAGNGDLNVKYYEGKFDAYQRTYIVEVIPEKKNKLHLRYAYHFLETYLETLREQSIGGIIKYIKMGNLTDAQIPLPSLAEQKRIARILDAADALRAKRREALAQLDALLRSTFLTLFGDPVTNPMGWPEVEFEEVVESTKLGMVRGSTEFGWNLPVPYVRMDAITNDGRFLPEKVQSTKATQEDVESYGLRSGDFLLNTRNSKELVGKVTVFRGPAGWTFNNNLIRIRFIKSVKPDVIATQFRFQKVQQALEKRKAGTTSVFAIYWKSLKSLPVLCPPLPLQQKFAAIVESVERQKSAQRAHLAELDALFASLQHRAFRGEL